MGVLLNEALNGLNELVSGVGSLERVRDFADDAVVLRVVAMVWLLGVTVLQLRLVPCCMGSFIDTCRDPKREEPDPKWEELVRFSVVLWSKLSARLIPSLKWTSNIQVYVSTVNMSRNTSLVML